MTARETSTVTGQPALLRQINCARVLDVLRGTGELRLADLAALTGLSRPTVGQAVEKLHEAGLVSYVEPRREGAPRSGRPPRRVRFRAEAGYLLGMDIGPHKVLVVVANLLGDVIAIRRHTTSASHSSRELLATLRATARAALAAAGVTHRDVVSVAAGAPGIVDVPNGTITLAPGLPRRGLDLASELRRWFDCPVQVENDANLAVLAERRHGAARDAHTVVVVLWGERVGAGVLIGDRLHRGAANAAGEIGYLALDSGSTAEPDAQGRGPFERMVGADAIRDAGRSAARRHGGTLSELADADPDRLDAAAVFAAAAHGDTAGGEAVRTIAARFARGLAPVLLVLDPDLVVISAGVSRAGPVLLKAIEASVRPLTLVPPHLTLSSLGDEAVALGAVELALADAGNRLLPTAGLAAVSLPAAGPLVGGLPDVAAFDNLRMK